MKNVKKILFKEVSKKAVLKTLIVFTSIVIVGGGCIVYYNEPKVHKEDKDFVDYKFIEANVRTLDKEDFDYTIEGDGVVIKKYNKDKEFVDILPEYKSLDENAFILPGTEIVSGDLDKITFYSDKANLNLEISQSALDFEPSKTSMVGKKDGDKYLYEINLKFIHNDSSSGELKSLINFDNKEWLPYIVSQEATNGNINLFKVKFDGPIEKLKFHQYKPEKIVIPNEIDGKNVVGIDKKAFYNKNLEDVVLPQKIEFVNDYAFSYNNLKTIKLSEGVSQLTTAFSNNNIESINLSNVKKIEEYALVNNDLDLVNIPNNIEYIKNHAFEGNDIENIVVD